MTVPIDLFLHPKDKTPYDWMGDSHDVVGRYGWFAAKIEAMNVKIVKSLNLSAKIKVDGECKQYKNIHEDLSSSCSKLGMLKPECYVDISSASTITAYGDTMPCIVVSSALIDKIPRKEVHALLARECGHIICRHVRNSSTYESVLKSTDKIVDVVKLIEKVIPFADDIATRLGALSGDALKSMFKGPFVQSRRFGEFSADRIASFVVDDPHVVIKALARKDGLSEAAITTLVERIDADIAKCDSSALDECHGNNGVDESEDPCELNSDRIVDLLYWFAENKSRMASCRVGAVNGFVWLEK